MSRPGKARRFWRNRVAVTALAIFAVIALACIFGPFFMDGSYGEPSDRSFAPPSAAHPFGTDLNGRDVLYRILIGGRISLLVGLCGALVSAFIGTTYGLIAGYIGGRVDEIMMRIVDILYSVPRLIFILICIGAFNQRLQEFAVAMDWTWMLRYSSIIILIIALGVIEWLTLARIVRGQVLSLKSRTFVTAAVALGQSHTVILTRHLLPNLLGVILIYLTLTIPAVIIDESFLSFLGLGVQSPLASWGSLLADGAGSLNPIYVRWWLIVFPAAAMALTLLSLNFLGDALRDTLDPRRDGK